MPGSFPDPHRRPEPAGRGAPTAVRRRATRSVLAGAAVAALTVPLLPSGPPAAADQPRPSGSQQRTALQEEFAQAARRYHVPEQVLLGVSYLQSRWDAHRGTPSVSGGYGPMHLTDARTALAASRAQGHGGQEDARGDTARPARVAAQRAVGGPEKLPGRLRTLERAAELTGLPRERLRTSPAANVRGGAALLAAAQKRLDRPLSADPAQWYDAVAAYPEGGRGRPSATAFADDVFAVLRQGERRVTDSGDSVALAADPALRAPGGARAGGGGADKGTRGDGERARGPECPASVDCEWVPAPYEKYTNDEGEEDYGNHDTSRRPSSQKIDYIVVHSTETSYEEAQKLVQDPTYVSWNYTLRSSDGHVAQHVRNKDTAWHSGNWYVNSTSVGVEHEGFLADPDAWYTEAMYRSSARLVRHLARTYDIPLDRQHVLGHDNVPGLTPSAIKDMHTDPGPYWDWQHYFALLGKPFTPQGGTGNRSKDGGLVTIRPDYDRNRPEFTGCKKPDKPCAAHGSGAVRLHTAPDASAPLVKDAGLHPDGGASTKDVNDTGARASTGQQYAVAGRKGAWTAVWYLGQKAWFHNPRTRPTAVPARGTVVEPRAGKKEIPVYGGAYPEKAAYPQGVPAQKLTPLPYTVAAGQRYAAGEKKRGAYLYAADFDPDAEKFTVVRGKQTYYQIQLGHRVAFVRAEDVRVVNDH